MKIKYIYLLFVLLIIFGVFLFNNKHGPRGVTVIVIDDTTELNKRIVWDKDGKLVNPERLNDLLANSDSIRVKFTALNGSVLLRIDRQSGVVKELFKRDYSNEHYYFSISRDTVSITDSVLVSIRCNKKHTFKPEQSDEYEYLKDTIKSDLMDNFQEISIKNFTREGNHSFMGKLINDTDTISVSYNFYVIR